jgi:hypothetical protein
MFESLILRYTLAGGTTVWIGIVPAELFKSLALRADILVVLSISIKVDARPCAVSTTGFVDDRDVGRNLALHQPVQHGARSVGGIRD